MSVDFEFGSSVHVAARHKATYIEPLVVQAGEAVTVTDRDSEWKGWLWCLNAKGKGGWLPTDIVQHRDEDSMVTEDFSTAELSVNIDEVVILHQYKNGWFWVTNQDSQSGWVPAECLAV